jgi:hypothetical protein
MSRDDVKGSSGSGRMVFEMLCPGCGKRTPLGALKQDAWECSHCFSWWQTRPCAKCHRHLALDETGIHCSECRGEAEEP